jgi:HSP20 family protein
MDRLFAGSVIMPDYMSAGSEGWPPTNLHITEDNVVVSMAIPGASPDDINVSVTGDSVTVSGEVRDPSGSARDSQGKRSQTYFDEIWHGKFQRSFTLPIQVDANGATANYEHGILTLTLPKSEATKPRKIQVRPQQQTIQGESQQATSGSAESVPVQGE